ncbi:MAG: chemotaxis protein CheW [Thermodesulfobacteriota bacterium]
MENQLCEYLIFQLGDIYFAFSAEQSSEIIAAKKITPLPQMPEFFCGVMNLRGDLHPAADLRLKLDMDYLEDTKDTVFILVNVQTGTDVYEAAVRVDKVIDVDTIQENDFTDADPENLSALTEFLLGSFLYNDKAVYILNPDTLLSPQELGLI